MRLLSLEPKQPNNQITKQPNNQTICYMVVLSGVRCF